MSGAQSVGGAQGAVGEQRGRRRAPEQCPMHNLRGCVRCCCVVSLVEFCHGSGKLGRRSRAVKWVSSMGLQLSSCAFVGVTGGTSAAGAVPMEAMPHGWGMRSCTTGAKPCYLVGVCLGWCKRGRPCRRDRGASSLNLGAPWGLTRGMLRGVFS